METILVVDDDSKVREIAGQCLIEHGVAPVYAQNGREAIEILARQSFDAVLTDLHMPRLDGLALVQYMRQHHPGVPAVLMTARGSEQSAVAALRAGALSYVPKKDLKADLCNAMGIVMAAVEARRHRERVRGLLEMAESVFVLGYEPDGPLALVSHLQGHLSQFNFCDETGMFQVSTALAEAFHNAVDHGNLELDSAIREKSSEAYARLREQRQTRTPWRDRRVRVTERLTPPVVTYVVRDEGPGFDLTTVPDPTKSENLLKVSGRGLMLIRTFMDEVSFNDTGNEITMVKRRTSD